ncbi:hypothetical protein GO684_00205 [Wolbachia endosymbiont of Litomosoides brasiliensis]|uniref:hypothetical protein n=1 Tax=Wolbachia endosymbiont of Litomosoides brasiliensis TaxID=1812117 RepID=UPI0015897BED|nr:hypothetical protein [Wolbachia endosymbiont of Litomosoides brasiliensis]NUY39178.1 hypothetical protein [Wolbachia endosymbiont of Litomosoides brasiliensis]
MNDSASIMDEQNVTLMFQDDSIEYKLKEIVNFAENKVISPDGLTLLEVFQALVQMLNGDLELVKKVLAYANTMAKHGMKIAKESQLNKADVHRVLESKKIILQRQDFMKKSPPLSAIKQIKKKSRGL